MGLNGCTVENETGHENQSACLLSFLSLSLARTHTLFLSLTHTHSHSRSSFATASVFLLLFQRETLHSGKQPVDLNQKGEAEGGGRGNWKFEWQWLRDRNWGFSDSHFHSLPPSLLAILATWEGHLAFAFTDKVKVSHTYKYSSSSLIAPYRL